jgi:ureidoacrylate peracid hydrolase
MHKVKISEEIIERLMQRRGKVHIYDSVNPKTSAFVVIDMQNAFCKPGAPVEVPSSRGIVGNINRLAEGLRNAGGDVIWITTEITCKGNKTDWENLIQNIVAADVREKTTASMAPGADGVKLWHELDLREEDIYLVKNRYSCLAPSACTLERVLRSRGIDTLLISGTKTNVCCETAARNAFDLDFNVIMVSGCNSALSDREHLAALETLIQQFGDVRDSGQVLQMIDQ